MLERFKKILAVWRKDYLYSTVFASACTAAVNIAFAVYNGMLGIIRRSLWNGSICAYYLLLAGIRATVVYAQRGSLSFKEGLPYDKSRKIYFCTHLIMLLMNLSLIVPIAVMVRGERSYDRGLTTAIAMAAYTVYRVTLSIINSKKARKYNNILISELRTINMIDSLVAVLTLQNALIMANGGQNESMTVLTARTSAGILLIIVIITVRSFTKGIFSHENS